MSSNIFEICSYCDKGKIKRLSFLNTILVLLVVAVIGVLLFSIGQVALHVLTEKLQDKEVSIKSPMVIRGVYSALILAVFVILTHSIFNAFRKLKALFTHTCPHCEEGYIIKNRVGLFRTAFHFIDLFIFEQILIPMYKTLTFQHFWNNEKKESKLVILVKTLFYLFLFFGSIPLLILLMGGNKMAGLFFALAVMGYIIYIILVSNEEERDYQKSIIFLLIPIYYVSMVEIFRWAWVLSPGTFKILPDQSEFLYMGLENLIRTQLFMDLFEVYDMNMGDLEATSFLAHSAIFLTRLLLDIALISMLIRAAIESYRRTWIFKHTGKKTAEVTEGEVLIELENMATQGKPGNIHEMKEQLYKVLDVFKGLKPYVSGVLNIADDQESKQAANECAIILENINTPKEVEYEKVIPQKIGWGDRILSIIFVAIWAILFSIGIHIFIKEVTKREIQMLMTQAASKELKTDPLSRRDIYLRVIKKDKNHDEALMECAKTYLEIADLNVKLLNLDQALIDLDKSFAKGIRLQKLVGREDTRYISKLEDFGANAYLVRGKVFFLKNDIERSISELRKSNKKNKGIRRALYQIFLYKACENLEKKSASGFISEARIQLGFDPQYKPSVLITLVKAIEAGYHKKTEDVIRYLNEAVASKKIGKELRPLFINFLGNLLMRKGGKNLTQAEKLFSSVLKAHPENVDTLFSMANLEFMNKRYAQAQKLLEQLINQKGTPENIKNQAHIQLGLILLTLGQKEKAKIYFHKVIQQHHIRKRFRESIHQFLAGKINAEQLIDASWSWDVTIADSQKSLAHFYIAIDTLTKKQFGEASKHFRRCFFLKQEKLPEYHMAKLQFENLQIRLEGKSYQMEFFMNKQYLTRLTHTLQKRLRYLVRPEQETLSGLNFVLSTRYDKEKRKAIDAVRRSQALRPDLFIAPLDKALDCEDDEVKLAALEGFFSIKEKARSSEKKILKLLSSENENIRRAVVKVIATFGTQSIPSLLTALKDKDKYVRRDAAYAFAKLGVKAKPAIKELTEKVFDPEIMVRDAAFAAVKNMGKEAAPIYETLIFKSKDVDIKSYSIRELSKIAPEHFTRIRDKIIPVLIKMLFGKDTQNRNWAALKLLTLKTEEKFIDKKAKEKIIEGMQDNMKTSDLRRRLLSAMWYLDCANRWDVDIKPVIDIYFELLEIGDAKNRKVIFQTFNFKDIQGKASLKVFVSLLKHPNKQVKALTQKALIRFSENLSSKPLAKIMIDELFALIRSKDSKHTSIVQSSLKGCIEAKFELLTPLVLPFLGDQNPEIQKAALIALDLANNEYEATPKDKELLIGFLKSSHDKKFIIKVFYDFKLKNKHMFPILFRSLESKDRNLVTSAIRSLSFYSEEKQRILPKLEKMLIASLKKNEGKKKSVDKDNEDDEGEDDEGEDDEGEDDEGEDDEGEDDEEEGDEDDESPAQAIQESILFTMGTLEGFEYAYKRCQNNPLLQKRLIIALGDIASQREEEEKQIEYLTKYLQAKDTKVVLLALEELNEQDEGLEGLAKPLQNLQKHSNKEVRLASLGLLLKVAPPKDIKILLSLLASKDSEVRFSALKIIEKNSMKRKAIPKLTALLKDEEHIAKKSAQILASIGKYSLKYLRRALYSKNSRLQLHSVYALGLMGKTSRVLLGDFAKHLKKKDPKLIASIMSTLVNIVKPSDRRIILRPIRKIAALSGIAEQTKLNAWLCLYKMGYKSRVLPYIMKMLNKSKNPKNILVKLVRVAPKETVTYLRNKVRQRYDSFNVVFAIDLLATIGSDAKPALGEIEDLTYDPNPFIRSRATNALKKMTK